MTVVVAFAGLVAVSVAVTGLIMAGGWVGEAMIGGAGGRVAGGVSVLSVFVASALAVSAWLDDRWCVKTFGRHSWEMDE